MTLEALNKLDSGETLDLVDKRLTVFDLLVSYFKRRRYSHLHRIIRHKMVNLLLSCNDGVDLEQRVLSTTTDISDRIELFSEEDVLESKPFDDLPSGDMYFALLIELSSAIELDFMISLVRFEWAHGEPEETDDY